MEDKVAFAKSKAENFRSMLKPFCNTPETAEFLERYSNDEVQALTLQYLAPLYHTNTLHIARNASKETLKIDDSTVITKIDRYLQCFCECLLE